MTIDKARRKQIVALWHRRLAVFVSLWLVLLAASGVLINHAHELGLDRSPLPAFMQGTIYGIDSGSENFCDTVADIGPDCSGVFARMALPVGAVLLDEDSLFIIDEQGQLLEKLGIGHFGLGSLKAGLYLEPQIYLRDTQRTVRTDADFLDWEVLGTEAATTMTGSDWQVRDDQADAVSWERLMLDLHAARFLGPLAKWFNDLMAALILFLAISGIRLYRLKRNGNANG